MAGASTGWQALASVPWQALALLGLAVVLAWVGGLMLLRVLRQDRSQHLVDSALAARAGKGEAGSRGAHGLVPTPTAALAAAVALGNQWGQGRYGSALLAAEDRQLIDRCGFAQPGRARALFVLVRVVLTVGLPTALLLLWGGFALAGSVLFTHGVLTFFGVAIGWMLPKWALQRRARHRRDEAVRELPLLLDLLRLLQGVGLSMDQTLHVIAGEFRDVLPVLGGELALAVERHAHGLPREASLQRLTQFGDEDLAAVVRLIVQVEAHGGAVQEPLRVFGERVREQRRMALKEQIGRLTVKMTGVMVLTLLPALLIVSGGAGFLALYRGLMSVSGGG